MNKKMRTIRSSVKPSLMRHLLLRGTLFGVVGALIWFYASLFFSLEEMNHWGTLIWIFGGTLIACGFIPYKRLTLLEVNPYEMTLHETETLIFSKKGNPLFSIPVVSLGKMEHVDTRDRYGIALWLKHPVMGKITLHGKQGEKAFRQFSCHREGSDLFFPFFSQQGFNSLQEHLL